MTHLIWCRLHGWRRRNGWLGIKSAAFVVFLDLIVTSTALAQIPSRKTLAPSSAVSQPASSPLVAEVPQDPLGRDTPYGTVMGFLKFAEQGNWERAAEFLDSKQPAKQKRELARQLKLVMDQGLSLNLEAVTKKPEGAPTEKHRITRTEIGTARIGDRTLLILLDRAQPTKAPPYWLFSAETLDGVQTLAANLEAPWFEKYVPQSLMETEIFGITVFRLISVPLAVVIVFGLIWLGTRLIRLGFVWILRKARGQNAAVPKMRFLGPIQVLILAYLTYIAGPAGVTLVARDVYRHVAIVATILGFTWLLIRVVGLVAELVEARFRKTYSLGKIAPLELASWTIKVILAVVSVVVILYTLNIDPTTVVTGLGLGGVALAFAAQKTIENVFGTVMIVADQPVRVGDFCRLGDSMGTGDTTGTIEEVGIRSTRVRTLDQTQLIIPNGHLASMVLENFSSRTMILLRHVISLRRETTADQIRYVLREIRTYLEGHAKVDAGTMRVRFIHVGGSSFDLEIYAYILVKKHREFLEVQEEVLLHIMDIIEGAGTALAFPSQTTYLARDTRPDVEKSRRAIEQARRWSEGRAAS